MIYAILSGCCGRMGTVISRMCEEREDIEIVAGVDKQDSGLCPFPVYANIENCPYDADVLIDFSHPSSLSSLLGYALEKRLPAVICTTGLSAEQVEEVKSASQCIPLFFSANMSLGVNLLTALAEKAASVLGDGFDIEIIEMHHNQKLDAPSGTALMLADKLNEALDGQMSYTYDRHNARKKRDKKEIGIHAVRGGTITGEHQVIFAGHDEIITLSHSARSREVFGSGAVSAALFLAGKPAGLYDMSALMK